MNEKQAKIVKILVGAWIVSSLAMMVVLTLNPEYQTPKPKTPSFGAAAIPNKTARPPQLDDADPFLNHKESTTRVTPAMPVEHPQQ